MDEEPESLLTGTSKQDESQLNKPRRYSIEEESCIICLQKIIDKTALPQCSHDSQCFSCLIEWTKHSSKCPLCITEIGPYVLHNIRGKHDFSRYFISPPIPEGSMHPSRERHDSFMMGVSSRRLRREEARRRDELDSAISRRRAIYQDALYAKHVASNRYTRYTSHPTPAQIASSPELQSRATAFLRRELRVWGNLDVEFLTNYIVTLVKTLDLRSEAAIKLLSDLVDPRIPYTEDSRKPNTEHLAHELISYLRSPYKTIEVYDRVVQYEASTRLQMRPIPSRNDADDARHSLSPPRSRSPSPSIHHKRKRDHSPQGVEHQRRRAPHREQREPPFSDMPDVESRRKEDGGDHSELRTSNSGKGKESSSANLQNMDLVQEPNQHRQTQEDQHDKATLIEHVRSEMIQRRFGESGSAQSGAVELNPATSLTSTEPITDIQYTASRREELYNRLQQEKSRIEATVPFQGVDPTLESARSGGLQIKGAAAKAKEKALQEMEHRLRRQAILRIKLAREKSQLSIQDDVQSSPTSPSKMMRDMALTSLIAEPSLQQKLKERLLRERLLLSRGMSTSQSSQPTQ